MKSITYYTAMDIARYVITSCYRKKIPVSNLKLQKLLYFIQGASYSKKGKAMFNDRIHAWQFGPVVPDVYYEFCAYAATPILLEFENDDLEADDIRIIDQVIEEKGRLSPWSLVNETHRPGTPWDLVFGKEENGAIIPENMMKAYFYKG